MHVFFSGIGGAGASSLSLIAKQAGCEVSGSDATASSTLEYLKKHGISDIYVGQSEEAISKLHANRPIDMFVYTSALPPGHEELKFAKASSIPALKHDEFLADFINQHQLQLIAIAGTHGKSTTTAMAVWAAKELGIKASWSVGAKMSFADSGHFEPGAKYFICEADEFDRKFLSLYPRLSLIPGLDWDHPDIYPTRESYLQAFGEFIEQSEKTVLWQNDAEALGLEASPGLQILDSQDNAIDTRFTLSGRVNRQNAWLVVQALAAELNQPLDKLVDILNKFPGLARRFEELAPNIYSDYAHTPAKIRGALQLAEEVAGNNVIVVYEGLHNLRQHFIKDELAHLFDGVKYLYVVPSYLAREDPSQKVLTPADLKELLSDESKAKAETSELDDYLLAKIKQHADSGELVLCLTAGGGDSLDEWLRSHL